MSAAARQLVAALAALPLPTVTDGTGRLARWGAGIRPDGRWGAYTLNDGRTRTWSALVAANAREAIAMSRALNARGDR